MTYDIIGQNYDIIGQNYDIIASTMISGVPRFQMVSAGHLPSASESAGAGDNASVIIWCQRGPRLQLAVGPGPGAAYFSNSQFQPDTVIRSWAWRSAETGSQKWLTAEQYNTSDNDILRWHPTDASWSHSSLSLQQKHHLRVSKYTSTITINRKYAIVWVLHPYQTWKTWNINLLQLRKSIWEPASLKTTYW